MPLVVASEVAPLLTRARASLGLSQRELADRLGVSARTVMRWNGRSVPTMDQLVEIVKAVHPLDPGLASELAVACGKRLAELGLDEPLAPAAEVPAKELAIDSIVHAAAEASDTSPKAARAAVVAALERAAALGVRPAALVEALKGRSGERG